LAAIEETTAVVPMLGCGVPFSQGVLARTLFARYFV
jgi:hypothetical protein